MKNYSNILIFFCLLLFSFDLRAQKKLILRDGDGKPAPVSIKIIIITDQFYKDAMVFSADTDNVITVDDDDFIKYRNANCKIVFTEASDEHLYHTKLYINPGNDSKGNNIPFEKMIFKTLFSKIKNIYFLRDKITNMNGGFRVATPNY
jgi:hypothetical protein